MIAGVRTSMTNPTATTGARKRQTSIWVDGVICPKAYILRTAREPLKMVIATSRMTTKSATMLGWLEMAFLCAMARMSKGPVPLAAMA